MYKCCNCGNSEKFIGFAQEKGNALIYQISEKSNFWIYNLSDQSWKSTIKPIKCYYCGSKNIKNL